MEKIEKSEMLFNKIKKLVSNDLNLISVLKLFKVFLKMRNERNFKYIKLFISEYYSLDEDMPEDFYQLILNKMHQDDYLLLFNILIQKNIYSLISYLKYHQEDILELEETITPLQYYNTPKRYINRIIETLKILKDKNDDNDLDVLLKDELMWSLKRNPMFNEVEYRFIAYKIYLSIGFENGLELLTKKYGEIDYEKVYFMFSKLNTKDKIDKTELQAFNNFLFSNKKDPNNITRSMLNGKFKELFLNFDYFYNNFDYFTYKLGTKISRDKVSTLLKERYLAQNPSIPEITGDILEDMVSSYQCKYEFLHTAEQEIHRKNFEIYNEFLKNKYKSSIPMINISDKGEFICEIISLSDPRNLVLGYRSGNCFRINGDAAILFHGFLQSEPMRLLSISTSDNKDLP